LEEFTDAAEHTKFPCPGMVKKSFPVARYGNALYVPMRSGKSRYRV
jgi:hypothetical protein